MRKLYIGFTTIFIGLAATLAFAKATPKPFTASPIRISGTLSGAAATCTGYAGTCLGGSTCVCSQDPNAVARGIGTADIFINQATGDTTFSDGSISTQGCTPFVATAAITDTKTSATATLNIVGSACDVTGRPQTITGGYSVASETPSATGFGTMIGSLNGSALSLTLVPTK